MGQAGRGLHRVDIERNGRLRRRVSATLELEDLQVTVSGSKTLFMRPRYKVGLEWGRWPPRCDKPLSGFGYSERRGKYRNVAGKIHEDEQRFKVERGQIAEVLDAVAEKLKEPMLKNGQ